MAGMMVNGSSIQGIYYNGQPCSAMYNGQIVWPPEKIPVTRYEYTLWKSPDGLGRNSGTMASAFSSFDEIVVGYSWPAALNLHGVEYKTFVPFTTHIIERTMSNNNAYYMFETLLSSNQTSWNCPTTGQFASSFAYRGINTNTSTTTGWSTVNNTGRYVAVSEIIGVKYR